MIRHLTVAAFHNMAANRLISTIAILGLAVGIAATLLMGLVIRSQFSIPVLAANVIAWPVAWYYLRHWLETYAYRIALSPLYFLAAGLIALAVAWATIITHTVLTARANPIRALRYE